MFVLGSVNHAIHFFFSPRTFSCQTISFCGAVGISGVPAKNGGFYGSQVDTVVYDIQIYTHIAVQGILTPFR